MWKIRAAGGVKGLALGMVVLARVAGQDVTVTAPEWMDRDEPPDTLPVLKSRLHPEFPETLRTTPDSGYVSESVIVDEKGAEVGESLTWSLEAYDSSVVAESFAVFGNSVNRYRPATRGGKPVLAQIHFCVVFNPASASDKGPDATPRLLDAWPIYVSAQAYANAGFKGDHIHGWCKVSVDADGHPMFESAAPEAEPLLAHGFERWRFAPGRKGGRPIAMEVRVPFVIMRDEAVDTATETPPRPVHREMVVYPMYLQKLGMRGEVVVHADVDIEGRVKRPYVVRTINPAFNEAALQAMKRWSFEPARRGSIPVAGSWQQIFQFTLENRGGGYGPLEVQSRADMSKLPEELRYDVGPRIRSVVLPVYPVGLLTENVKGSAEVQFLVDVFGRVVASKVVSASRPEFGYALQAAAERFDYQPALRGGLPHKALQRLNQEFAGYELSDGDVAALRLLTKHPERIAKPNELDAPVKPVVRFAPVFPLSLLNTSSEGSATVEMLVDGDGLPRLPRVVSASDPLFGYSAVQAVALWSFEPPRKGGQPAVVRVQVPFDFKLSPKS